jgi:glycosyltransferase involved in cell wall biosynthesis
MYLGLPIIASDVVYNKATTEGKALYFADSNELITQVRAILQSNEKLDSLRKEMKSIAERRYTWGIITNKYESLY